MPLHLFCYFEAWDDGRERERSRKREERRVLALFLELRRVVSFHL